LDVLVEDLEALRLTLNLKKIHLVGHDLSKVRNNFIRKLFY